MRINYDNFFLYRTCGQMSTLVKISFITMWLETELCTSQQTCFLPYHVEYLSSVRTVLNQLRKNSKLLSIREK